MCCVWCWAFIADLAGADECFFPSSSGKLVDPSGKLVRSQRDLCDLQMRCLSGSLFLCFVVALKKIMIVKTLVTTSPVVIVGELSLPWSAAVRRF